MICLQVAHNLIGHEGIPAWPTADNFTGGIQIKEIHPLRKTGRQADNSGVAMDVARRLLLCICAPCTGLFMLHMRINSGLCTLVRGHINPAAAVDALHCIVLYRVAL